MKTWVSCALAACLSGAAVAGAGAGLYEYFVGQHAAALPGTWVGRYRLPLDQSGESLGEWLESKGQRFTSEEVYLVLPEEIRSYELTDLGVELHVGRTMQHLAEASARGTPFERVQRALGARRGDVEIEPAWSLNRDKARAVLEDLAAEVRRAPVNARLDLAGHARVDDEPGRELDIEATLAALTTIDPEATPAVKLRFRSIPASVTSEMLEDVDVSKVLAAYETSFRGKAGPRAVNIVKAAEYLNGTIIGPGEELSFNKTVGARSLERGFTWAPEIIQDELVPGIGGGVCQVATTLHAAAVFGMFDITRRRSHSRPSGYAPLGLDATVIYGEVDLKIKNPFETPVIIHAFLPSQYVIRVELLGLEPPAKVEHVYSVTDTHDFLRRVTIKDWMDPDEKRRRQRGNRGYDVVSVVRMTHADGEVERRVYRSKYHPVPEIYWVGPGYDLGALPELPEGATHTEADGEPVPDSADIRAGATEAEIEIEAAEPPSTTRRRSLRTPSRT